MILEELRNKQTELRKQSNEVEKQLFDLSMNERKLKLERLVGKCYVKEEDEKLQAWYIYELDETCLELNVLHLQYYFDNELAHFHIGYFMYYHHLTNKIEDGEVEEISKDEFDKHYKIALKLCETAKGIGMIENNKTDYYLA